MKYLVSIVTFGRVTDFAMLNQPNTALGGVGIAALWKQIPLMTLLLLAGLQNVPDDIEIFNTQKIVKQLLGGNKHGSGRTIT